MALAYREGTEVDPKKLDELWTAIGWRPRGTEKWEEVLSKTFFMCTAWDGENLVGSGRIMEDGIMCMLYDIGVHPKYHRQGIGSRILKRLIEEVKDKQYASIGLFAWEQHPANVPFYEEHGFVRKSSGMELDPHMNPE